MRVVIIHPEQWNGGSDRCTIGFLRHFVQAGHQVAWLTTMIDDYWADEEFKGVGKFKLTQNKLTKILQKFMRFVSRYILEIGFHKISVFFKRTPQRNTLLLTALAYHIIFRTRLKPDLIVADHSASCVPLLKWWFPKVRAFGGN
uniref:Glyco_trans_4-like_N domain-containing protein n=1 Tax=Meloidogyne hapla TaxID=6305 RepID=A0A1I8BIE9_MELHA